MNRRLVAFGIAALVVIGAVVGGIVTLAGKHTTNQPAPMRTISVTPTKSPSPGTGVDCGKVTLGVGNATGFNACFNQHFAVCQPARITIDNENSTLKGVVVSYNILTRRIPNCLVRWSYQKLPYNTSWEKKDITCPYRQGPDFQKALEAKTDFGSCTGPLLDTINSATAAPVHSKNLSFPTSKPSAKH